MARGKRRIKSKNVKVRRGKRRIKYGASRGGVRL